ncbi:reverse transcriptase domain-containing protein [Trichonephila clavipes]|nr:reverse transcriptase domain-containing protein [Trichonephila clavipes]
MKVTTTKKTIECLRDSFARFGLPRDKLRRDNFEFEIGNLMLEISGCEKAYRAANTRWKFGTIVNQDGVLHYIIDVQGTLSNWVHLPVQGVPSTDVAVPDLSQSSAKETDSETRSPPVPDRPLPRRSGRIRRPPENLFFKEGGDVPPTTDYDENSTEVQAITVLLPQQEVTIINTYHPDNSDINLDLLNTLLDINSDTKILLGDLNAKSPSWGSRTLDLKGSQIEDLLCDNDLSILNDKRSTYLSKTNGTTSALDITAINHQTASQATWKILKSAIIDHFPIITSINQRVDGTIQSKRSWNFRKANWRKFTSELEMLCSLSSPHTLDERLRSFASHINAAAKRSIPRVKRRNDWVPFWKDTNIENLINERDKLSTELQMNNTETNRIRFTNLCHEVEEVISSCKRKKWTEFCETLDPQKISQHWKVIKTLNNQSTHQKADIPTNIISSSGRDAATNKETASLLAKTL